MPGSSVAILLAVLIALGSSSQESLAITIYSSFGYVRDSRQFNVQAGTSTLSFTDVAASILPETVTVKDVTHPDSVSVFQQTFDQNLVSASAIANKYIGSKVDLYITLGSDSRKTSGTLLSADGSFIIQNNDGVFSFNKVDAVDYPSLPAGFFTLPTLSWKISSDAAYTNDMFELVYRTSGISWTTDYTLILTGETTGDFGGWVSIDNRSGKKYTDAKVKLVAGDVNTNNNRYASNNMMVKSRSLAAPTQSDLGDFKMYTIQFPVDLNENSNTQVQLIPRVNDITVARYGEATFTTGGYEQLFTPISSMVDFANTAANKLGIPLPKGTVRVLIADQADNALEFIGEQMIGHTSIKETVLLNLGTAFDLKSNKTVSSRKDTGTEFFNLDNQGFTSDNTIRITNAKKVPATVSVVLNNYYADNLVITWTNLQKTLEKQSSTLYRSKVTVPAEGSWEISWSEIYTPK